MSAPVDRARELYVSGQCPSVVAAAAAAGACRTSCARLARPLREDWAALRRARASGEKPAERPRDPATTSHPAAPPTTPPTPPIADPDDQEAPIAAVRYARVAVRKTVTDLLTWAQQTARSPEATADDKAKAARVLRTIDPLLPRRDPPPEQRYRHARAKREEIRADEAVRGAVRTERVAAACRAIEEGWTRAIAVAAEASPELGAEVRRICLETLARVDAEVPEVGRVGAALGEGAA